MTDAEIDKRLSALLSEQAPMPDPAFVDRVVLAAQLDRRIQVAQQRALRRTLLECGAALAVALTFYLLSQEQPPLPDGTMSLMGPAMAGLVMLGLWAFVSLPNSNYGSASL